MNGETEGGGRRRRPSLVVNFFAGPGVGKSSTAAAVFAELKWDGISCELVTEFAKDLVWEHRTMTLTNQMYVFGKQLNRLQRLNGQVRVILTDSPLPLSIIYSTDRAADELIWHEFDKFNNLNIILNRQKMYRQEGRTQTEGEAKDLDMRIENLLYAKYYNDSAFAYLHRVACRDSIPLIKKDILRAL